MLEDTVPNEVVRQVAAVVADTHRGLSAGPIVDLTTAVAADHGVEVPHTRTPLGPEVPNKRTALYDNVVAFDGPQRYALLKAMLEDPRVTHPDKDLWRVRLVSRYGHLSPGDPDAEARDAVVAETRHWLAGYPKVLALYDQALAKVEHGVYDRNLLDDLRLALELLVQELVGNGKSLENNLAAVGALLKEREVPTEMRNMFSTLLNYYTKYQNDHVKHDDAVNETEVAFVIELTSAFMKYLVRVAPARA